MNFVTCGLAGRLRGFWRCQAPFLIWDKLAKIVGKILLLVRNLKKICTKSGKICTCFNWESQNLGQIYTKSGKISASVEKVKIWDKSAQIVGKYLLQLRKSKFETNPQKVLQMPTSAIYVDLRFRPTENLWDIQGDCLINNLEDIFIQFWNF